MCCMDSQVHCSGEGRGVWQELSPVCVSRWLKGRWSLSCTHSHQEVDTRTVYTFYREMYKITVRPSYFAFVSGLACS